MTTRWGDRRLTTAEQLAEQVPERLLNLQPYLYEDPEMSGLKKYMSDMMAWISSEVGRVDNQLTLEVMAEIGVTISQWYRHVLAQPNPDRVFAENR